MTSLIQQEDYELLTSKYDLSDGIIISLAKLRGSIINYK